MENNSTGIRMEDGQSATRAIYDRLKPYWQGRTLDDQDWAYVLACLKKIETYCETCKYRLTKYASEETPNASRTEGTT